MTFTLENDGDIGPGNSIASMWFVSKSPGRAILHFSVLTRLTTDPDDFWRACPWEIRY